jgi:putative aldouronate transport system substrate-binding protein
MSIETAPNPRLFPGQRLHNGSPELPVTEAFATSITSKCKDIENALKFLNFAYTGKGYMIYNFGTEGKTYNIVNKTPVFTDFMLNNPEGMTRENVCYIYKIHFAPKLAAPDTIANPVVVGSPDALAWRLKWFDDPNIDDSYSLPPVTLTDGETSEYNGIMVDLDTYASEMALKFIIGAEPLANFDSFIRKVEALEFRRAQAIMQDAYDMFVK